MPLLLDENDIRSLLTMPDLIAAMRPAMIEYSTGRARQPLRTVLELGENRSIFASMPASLHDPAAVGTKLVTVFPANHARGLPSHLATIVLLDPETGALMAILDGRYITEARTAAVSALSADVLARRDAGILAILGSGVQARSHLQALKCVRALREVRVWSPHESHRTAFAREMEPLAGVRITTAESPALAVQGADLIVTATASTTALIDAGDVSEGAHICAVGACRPGHRELGGRLVAQSRLFVDSRVGATAEAGRHRPRAGRGTSRTGPYRGGARGTAGWTRDRPPDGRGDYAVQVARHGRRGRRGRSSRVFEGARSGLRPAGRRVKRPRTAGLS